MSSENQKQNSFKQIIRKCLLDKNLPYSRHQSLFCNFSWRNAAFCFVPISTNLLHHKFVLNLLLQSTVRPKSCQTLSNGTFWANGGLLSQTRPLICKVYFRRHALHISWIMKNQENEYIEIRLEFVLLNSLVVAKLPGKGSRVQIPTNSWYFFNQIIGFYFFITDVPFYVLLQRQLPKTLKNGWKKSKKQLLARGSNPRHLTYSKIGVWRLRKKSTVMTSWSTIGVSVTRLAKINCKIRHPRHFLRLFARIYFKTFWTFATTKHFNSASSRLIEM